MSRQRPRTWVWLALIGIVALGAGLAATANTYVEAADHLDPPARVSPDTTMGGTATPDRNADIADVYAFHDGTASAAATRITTILTFAGPNPAAAGQEIPCDRDVLYTIHISNDADLDPEFDIRARFGMDDVDHCFVQIEGIPGVTGSIVAPVERVTSRSGADVYAGLRDDAFFFDLQGFRETIAMGSLRFMNGRDFFAGQNTPAIAVEFPVAAVGTAPLRIWATTGRRTGA